MTEVVIRSPGIGDEGEKKDPQAQLLKGPLSGLAPPVNVTGDRVQHGANRDIKPTASTPPFPLGERSVSTITTPLTDEPEGTTIHDPNITVSTGRADSDTQLQLLGRLQVPERADRFATMDTGYEEVVDPKELERRAAKAKITRRRLVAWGLTAATSFALTASPAATVKALFSPKPNSITTTTEDIHQSPLNQKPTVYSEQLEAPLREGPKYFGDSVTFGYPITPDGEQTVEESIAQHFPEISLTDKNFVHLLKDIHEVANQPEENQGTLQLSFLKLAETVWNEKDAAKYPQLNGLFNLFKNPPTDLSPEELKQKQKEAAQGIYYFFKEISQRSNEATIQNGVLSLPYIGGPWTYPPSETVEQTQPADIQGNGGKSLL